MGRLPPPPRRAHPRRSNSAATCWNRHAPHRLSGRNARRVLPLEAGLGIDSIKTLEIFNALKQYHPYFRDDDQQDQDDVLVEFAQLKTLGKNRRCLRPETPAIPRADAPTANRRPPGITKMATHSRRKPAVERFEVSAVATPLPADARKKKFPDRHTLLISATSGTECRDRHRPVGRLLSRLSVGFGQCRANRGPRMSSKSTFRHPHRFTRPTALVLGGPSRTGRRDHQPARPRNAIPPSSADPGRRRGRAPLGHGTFNVVKEFEDDIRRSVVQGGGWLINFTSLNGKFGIDSDSPSRWHRLARWA